MPIGNIDTNITSNYVEEINDNLNLNSEPKKSYKGLILTFISLVTLLIGVGAYFFVYTGEKVPVVEEESNASQNALSAYVSYLSGTAWEYIEGRRVEIKEGDTVTEGDEIMTDENTRMVLSFDDGSIVRLDEETLVILNTISSEKVRLIEENGHVFSRVNKDENHKFYVKAGGVTIESMGTAFSVENKEDVNVKVFESTVKVSETFGEQLELNEKEEWSNKDNIKETIREDEVIKNEFLAWSLEEDDLDTEVISEEKKEEVEKEIEEEEEEYEEPAEVNSGISLSSKKLEDGIFLSWTTSGINVSKGFKIVKSLDSDPTFPEDGYIYVSDSSVRNYKVHLKDGKTWYIRVCQYKGDGSCGVYSNEVEIEAPYVEENKDEGNGDVGSIKLEVTKKSDEKVKLTWSVDGKSDKGFKVVWSRNSKPTYPTRDGDKFHYLSESGAREDYVKDLDEGKKYYFRVCEYLGGKCGTYSNQVSITM